MNAASRVLLALIAGLALGAAGAATKNATLASVLDGVGVVGTLWINAIRMTVIPLVGALTVASVATVGDAKKVGRVGVVAVTVFVVLNVAGGVLAMVLTPLSFDHLSLPADVAANLRAGIPTSAATSSVQLPSLVQRLVDMVPVNPIKAAADGSLLPLVVFSLIFGLALSRVETQRRDLVVTACRSVADAMLVLVGWVLRFAPIGVFALALVLGLRVGASSARALLHYMVTLSGVLFVFTLLLYPLVVIIGRVPLRVFAAAAAPAQAVAFSVRSSLAALPAMIAGARDTLKLPSTSTGFVLPLAVSVFRVNVPMAWVVGVIFLGKLYGVPITEGQIAILIITSTLLSFSVPGIPSASLFLLSPVLVQNGLPAEGVGMLIALDAIPDMFKTTANVTAHLTSATLAARFGGPASAASP